MLLWGRPAKGGAPAVLAMLTPPAAAVSSWPQTTGARGARVDSEQYCTILHYIVAIALIHPARWFALFSSSVAPPRVSCLLSWVESNAVR